MNKKAVFFIICLFVIGCEQHLQPYYSKGHWDNTNYKDYCNITLDNSNFINGYNETYFTISNNHPTLQLSIIAKIQITNSNNEQYTKTINTTLNPGEIYSSKEYILCYYNPLFIILMIEKSSNTKYIV